jgi:meso-butanediol dehydrogenase/(S,S)-butanediol dehydrogenase/diacetyl reductase
MNDLVAGKVAVVTGAGAGIGRACALRLAEQGAKVLVGDIDAETAEATAALIRQAGGAAHAARVDVGERAQVFALIDRALQCWGDLDIVVNNAAAVLYAPLLDMEEETWQRTLQVTLSSAFYGTQAALRVMVPRGKGAIVNISSGAALSGEPGLGAYSAAKAGVINLTKTAAAEHALHGIRVNTVLPGATATRGLLNGVEHSPYPEAEWTKQIPSRRFGQPGEIADAVLFLVSPLSSYVNGATLVVDGAVSARTAAPRFDE